MKKRNKKEERNKKKTGEFNIIVLEGIGTPRQVASFSANRFVDDDKVPFIVNEQYKFKEMYPQDIQQTYTLDIEDIQNNIENLEKELKNLKNKKIEDVTDDDTNPEDIKKELRTLRAKERGYKFDKSGGYACVVDGITTFYFKREGNTFFPLKFDLVSNHIFVPSHPVIKKAGILLRNKEQKYLEKKLIETSVLILLIVVIVGTIANLIAAGYLYKKYDESNLAMIERDSIEAQQYCTDVLINQVSQFDKMLNKTSQQLDETSKPNIDGIIPS
jgi:hypothetical protein